MREHGKQALEENKGLGDKLDTPINFFDNKLKEFEVSLLWRHGDLNIDPSKHPKFDEMRNDRRNQRFSLGNSFIKPFEAKGRVRWAWFEGTIKFMKMQMSAGRAFSGRIGLNGTKKFRDLYKNLECMGMRRCSGIKQRVGGLKEEECSANQG